ncbi:MAG: iron donor protein CyaY [Shewanellaceae bacterium]|nr:iron donor protein CyaY [Shewanellaceae bacterium]
MTDSEFHFLADECFDQIEQAVEQLDLDIDIHRTGSLLSFEITPTIEIIMNKQEPLHQIWLASKLGGHHFSLVENHWFDERNQVAFNDCIQQVFRTLTERALPL